MRIKTRSWRLSIGQFQNTHAKTNPEGLIPFRVRVYHKLFPRIKQEAWECPLSVRYVSFFQVYISSDLLRLRRNERSRAWALLLLPSVNSIADSIIVCPRFLPRSMAFFKPSSSLRFFRVRFFFSFLVSGLLSVCPLISSASITACAAARKESIFISQAELLVSVKPRWDMAHGRPVDVNRDGSAQLAGRPSNGILPSFMTATKPTTCPSRSNKWPRSSLFRPL